MAKFGGSYYAITHSKQSQQVIIEMLKNTIAELNHRSKWTLDKLDI